MTAGGVVGVVEMCLFFTLQISAGVIQLTLDATEGHVASILQVDDSGINPD